jgi:hypothetical protein
LPPDEKKPPSAKAKPAEQPESFIPPLLEKMPPPPEIIVPVPATPSEPIKPKVIEQNEATEQLKREIEADKARLDQIKSDIESIQNLIDFYKERLDYYAARIESIENDEKAGLPFDKYAYRSAIRLRDYYFNLRNSTTSDLRAKKIVYDKLLGETSAKIDRYNRMMGAR